MPPSEKSMLTAYAARWEAAAPLLEAQRIADMQATDTAAAIASFARLWRDAVRRFPPGPTSGLVEQQRLFRRLHHP